jgi:hypothetical protein
MRIPVGGYRRRRMRSIDEPVRVEVARARPGLMHLLANHGPGGKRPEALLELVEAYLRLNPDDAEVRKMRDRLKNGTESPADLRGLFQRGLRGSDLQTDP